jgi:uncharacterized protein
MSQHLTGFYLYDKKYYYCSETHTLVNSEFKDLYSRNSGSRRIDIRHDQISVDDIQERVKNLKQVIFETTQQCNLKCRYCSYSSGEYRYSRPETSKALDIAGARKSIDYLWSMIKDKHQKKLSVGFYGGEPLLQARLVKETVLYMKKIFKDWELRFNITTNGMLLNPGIVGFMKRHNFSIFVSLDGPEGNNDAKRVLKDGCGSYAMVAKNLENIKNMDNDFYINNVSFSIVYSKDLSFETMFGFFRDHGLVKENDNKLSFVNDSDSTYYTHYPYDRRRFAGDRQRAVNSVLEKEKQGRELRHIELNLLAGTKQLADNLGRKHFSTLSGSCLFDSRLFISADGGIHVCEKMNESYPLGHMDTGFDYPAMQALAGEFSEKVRQHCLQCEIRTLCTKCYIHFAKDGKLELTDDFCAAKKNTVRKLLEEMIRLNESRENHANPAPHSPAGMVYRFHQLVVTEKGPVNTAIHDLLKGDVYQVPNRLIEKFENKQYNDIPDFMDSLKEAELVIEVGQGTWIPPIDIELKRHTPTPDTLIILELEEGVDTGLIRSFLSAIPVKIGTIYYYGEDDGFAGDLFQGIPVTRREKNHDLCRRVSRISGDFDTVEPAFYAFNKEYNGCWGKKLAITRDGKVRPCIYSTMELGDITSDNSAKIWEATDSYRRMTKEKIEKCSACELKFACFDCREIARKEGGKLTSTNPTCTYDPHKGTW